MIKISVIIPTSGTRPKELGLTLNSLARQVNDNFEILVINQSSLSCQNIDIESAQTPHIRWFNRKVRNKSKAINFAIPKCRGDIIAIIDDDGIIDKNWCQTAMAAFKNPKIDLVYGQLKPYVKTKIYEWTCCPAITQLNHNRIVSLKNFFRIGSGGTGANMLIRKSSLRKNGGFCEWLGPGSKYSAAEDWELAYRFLEAGSQVVLNKNLVVFHNRWILWKEYQWQLEEYLKGNTAMMFYLAIKYRKIPFYFHQWQYWYPAFINIIQTGFNNPIFYHLEQLKITFFTLLAIRKGICQGLKALIKEKRSKH